MEMEPSPSVIAAKKLWNILRIVFFMVRKGMSKSMLMVDLRMLLKRGKIAGKALGDLLLHHHSALTCRSDDIHLSFVSPREYEFSCSNSPAFPSYYYSRRKNHHHHLLRRRNYHHHHHRRAEEKNVVQKVFDPLNYEIPEASPLILPGFGMSPMVRQLRVTDSPFPLKDEKEDSQVVDEAAEEFIKKFYRELKHQKRMAALESPSPYHIWAG